MGAITKPRKMNYFCSFSKHIEEILTAMKSRILRNNKNIFTAHVPFVSVFLSIQLFHDLLYLFCDNFMGYQPPVCEPLFLESCCDNVNKFFFLHWS